LFYQGYAMVSFPTVWWYRPMVPHVEYPVIIYIADKNSEINYEIIYVPFLIESDEMIIYLLRLMLLVSHLIIYFVFWMQIQCHYDYYSDHEKIFSAESEISTEGYVYDENFDRQKIWVKTLFICHDLIYD
jgi:hypothetical protein